MCRKIFLKVARLGPGVSSFNKVADLGPRVYFLMRLRT